MDIQIHTIAKRHYCIDITEIHTFTETAQADNADDDDDNECGGMEASVKSLDNAVVWAGAWCLRSSVTVMATLTVLALLPRGSEMSVTLHTRSCRDRVDRRK